MPAVGHIDGSIHFTKIRIFMLKALLSYSYCIHIGSAQTKHKLFLMPVNFTTLLCHYYLQLQFYFPLKWYKLETAYMKGTRFLFDALILLSIFILLGKTVRKKIRWTAAGVMSRNYINAESRVQKRPWTVMGYNKLGVWVFTFIMSKVIL